MSRTINSPIHSSSPQFPVTVRHFFNAGPAKKQQALLFASAKTPFPFLQSGPSLKKGTDGVFAPLPHLADEVFLFNSVSVYHIFLCQTTTKYDFIGCHFLPQAAVLYSPQELDN